MARRSELAPTHATPPPAVCGRRPVACESIADTPLSRAARTETSSASDRDGPLSMLPAAVPPPPMGWACRAASSVAQHSNSGWSIASSARHASAERPFTFTPASSLPRTMLTIESRGSAVSASAPAAVAAAVAAGSADARRPLSVATSKGACSGAGELDAFGRSARAAQSASPMSTSTADLRAPHAAHAKFTSASVACAQVGGACYKGHAQARMEAWKHMEAEDEDASPRNLDGSRTPLKVMLQIAWRSGSACQRACHPARCRRRSTRQQLRGRGSQCSRARPCRCPCLRLQRLLRHQPSHRRSPRSPQRPSRLPTCLRRRQPSRRRHERSGRARDGRRARVGTC